MKIEPGIYANVPFEDYSRWRAVNHSVLKHFKKTPAHARWEMTHQDESTRFQDLGHTLHMAILEPERYAAEGPVVAPDVDRRTRQGKAEWAEFEASAAGRMIVTPKDKDTLDGILASIQRHATARALLNESAGVNELSICWVDPDAGILCKGRIDRLCEYGGYPYVVDLKTTHRPASTHGWQQQVESYALHEQAAHYLRGLQVLRPLEGDLSRRFAWLVCETEPPYCVRVFDADEAALQIGADEVAKYLAAYADCEQSGVWPGWPEGMDVAGLPPWVYKRYNVE
jgi:hypothetical protein